MIDYKILNKLLKFYCLIESMTLGTLARVMCEHKWIKYPHGGITFCSKCGRIE